LQIPANFNSLSVTVIQYPHLSKKVVEDIMSSPAPRISRDARRHSWFLYVAFAIAGALVTFAGARAQQKATDDATFRKLIDNYCIAWSSGNADTPAKFYAQEDNLVFYDVAPFSYHGWKDYHQGVQKELLDGAATIKLTAGQDLKVMRRANIAWLTVPMHLSEVAKDGKKVELDLRYTGIWERRGSGWLLVHEHISAPLGG
jgi:ketosteroid isomerase-like protein